MPLDGTQLGRYMLLRLIGSGGMGEVYLAEDPRINRQVAIKVIRTEANPNPDAEDTRDLTRRFEREARAIARLNHPHILPLFDYGEETVNGSALTYMVMPYCHEGSLGSWLRSASNAHFLSAQHLPLLLNQIAEALQYAHNQQIVHQDVKPTNFLIRSLNETGIPDLLLTDFGVAKFISANTNTSQTIRGTPIYMAPEQWEGHPVPATDQYALAIMTYQLLTGRLPYQGGPGQIMYQHLTAEPQPPSAFAPYLTPDVDSVLLHALAKKPEHRFASITAFAHAFQQAIQGKRLMSNTEPPTILSSTNQPADDRTTVDYAVSATPNHDKATFQDKYATIPSFDRNTSSNNPPLPSNPDQGLLKATPVPLFSYDQPINNQTAKSSKNRGLLIPLLVLLALLVIATGAGAFYFVTKSNPPPTVDINATSTAIAQAIIQHNQTATTSTQIAMNATATARVTPTPANPYPPNTGTLTLNDPLNDNSKGFGWEDGTRDGGTCTFTGQGYSSNIPQSGVFHSCLALNTNFSNFAFEVQATILSGGSCGIVFRADRATTHLYYFIIDRSGNFFLKVYYDKFGNSSIVTSGSSAAINTTGSNLIAGVAQGSTINLYVNHQLLKSLTDTTYTQGNIGVVALSGESIFSNAKVWTL